MRVLTSLIALLLVFINQGVFAIEVVRYAPATITPWEYNTVRCRGRHGPYATEQEAIQAGLASEYGRCSDARVERSHSWPTLENQARGTCGSTAWYPHKNHFIVGVEFL